MANYRAVATGNWSAGATWGGGAVPPDAAGHNIYSNGFTITIDQSVDVALITNAAITATFVGGGTSAAAGGGFAVASGSYTINASTLAGATTLAASLLTSNSTGIVTINATTISDYATTVGGTVINNSTGEVIISGVTSMNTGRVELRNVVGGTLRLNSCVISGGSSDNNTYRVRNYAGGSIYITGSTINTSVANFTSYTIYNVTSGNIYINSSTITSGTLSECIRNASSGTISITGSTLTPVSTTVLNNVSTGSIIISSSTLNAVNGVNCVVSTSSAPRISGSLISSANGTLPVYCSRMWLETPPLVSYIQHALDGVNALSYVRFYTADNNLAQANPTDVRNGVSYASGALTGRLTVPAEGSVSLNVTVGPLMPFTATRSSTTATATLAYNYPYTSGDKIVVTGASNAEWNGTYTIASVSSGTSITFIVPVTYSSTAGTGAQMQTVGTGIVTAADVNTAVNSAVTSATTSIINPNVTSSINSAVPTAVSTSMDAQWNKQTSTLTTSGSIGERLANASTVAVTGQQITNALG